MRISLPVTFCLCAAATAQVTRNQDIPLKNWPTALYWQPSQGETEAAEGKVHAAIRTTAPAAAAEPAFLVFVAMTPCRVVDTRASQMFPDPFGQPSLSSGPARTFTIQTSTRCPIPSSAQAYSLNVTVVPPGPLGYLTIYPHGQPTPNAVTLDDVQGQIVNNAAIVPAGTPSGAVDIIVNGNTDVVLDINGYYAPPSDLSANTSLGLNALNSNTTGFDNTATGLSALSSNTSGYANTAGGYQALFSNTQAYGNTGFGSQALYTNTVGIGNTAVGDSALLFNIASHNTATGYAALFNNTSGSENTAGGYVALYKNTSGSQNTADGYYALYSNTGGYFNSAIGHLALSNTTGDNNTALGASAGINISTGSNNIDISNNGAPTDGTALESGVIRIGDSLQTSFFAAGIAGAPVSNQATVLIDTSTGQLGTVVSSRRYKEEIEDLGDASVGLMRLRPVKFRYKRPYADGSKPLDYGLIAEEVAEIYPDLVAKSSDGQIETVQYHKLIPLLVNELQKERAAREQDREEQVEMIRSLQVQIAALREELSRQP